DSASHETDATRGDGDGGRGAAVRGIGGARSRALLAGLGPDAAEAASGTCVMTPAKTEGPYFVDERLNRSDIRGGQDGVPLRLRLQVFDFDADCAPVAGAQVDVWHANAAGRYSDEAASGTAGE